MQYYNTTYYRKYVINRNGVVRKYYSFKSRHIILIFTYFSLHLISRKLLRISNNEEYALFI